ncbi:prepilin-type N-terminal cleavage/methylation domain-containing protein [Paenibacillus zeisoli]|nr:prepilin-type N-terminal cleavage/methylation domain-containing protein [Paenibacillus zeisoli]
MRPFVKRLKKDEGVTLIELIAALSLLAVVLGMIYSVAVFGFKSYHKISVENSMRDEADILMSSIITNLYTFAPDRVIRDGADGTGIILQKDDIDSDGSSKVKERKITIQNNALYIRDLTADENTASTAAAGTLVTDGTSEVDGTTGAAGVTGGENDPVATNGLIQGAVSEGAASATTNPQAKEAGKIGIQSSVLVDPEGTPAVDRQNSVITLDDNTCRPSLPCESGLINIKLVLGQDYGGETYKLTLESKFGF